MYFTTPPRSYIDATSSRSTGLDSSPEWCFLSLFVLHSDFVQNVSYRCMQPERDGTRTSIPHVDVVLLLVFASKPWNTIPQAKVCVVKVFVIEQIISIPWCESNNLTTRYHLVKNLNGNLVPSHVSIMYITNASIINHRYWVQHRNQTLKSEI